MNTKFVLASVFAAIGGLAIPAKAGTDIHFNFGLIARPAPVIVAPAYCAPVAPVVVVEHRREEPRGYWKEVVVRNWVPAHWVVNYMGFGREYRSLQPGYFACNTERVWVSLDRGHDRDHDRDDYRR